MDLDRKALPLLVVDDEDENLQSFRLNFKRAFTVHTALSAEDGLKVLEDQDIAIIITDQRMPGIEGTEFLEKARELRPDCLGILVTAFGDADVLVDAINRGQVFRYFHKPWRKPELEAAIKQAQDLYHLRRENRRLMEELRSANDYLRTEIQENYDFEEIVGAKGGLQEVAKRLQQVAPTTSSVLLLGESGTGKELFARAIHSLSPRATKPLIKVNCAALAESVLESELFGHEKGAFTGAIKTRPGRFELADGGTLFLDEVGEMTQGTQVKLLRVLQELEFERVGGTETLKADVRVIAATNRDLEQAMRENTFREDLYYRLAVFPIQLPPLRERRDDIVELAEHFLYKCSRRIGKPVTSLGQDAIDRLLEYTWPGNVRELENVIERGIILCTGKVLGADELDFLGRGAKPKSATLQVDKDAGLDDILEQVEREKLANALRKAKGNKAAAAKILGINRSTLYYRLKRMGMDEFLK